MIHTVLTGSTTTLGYMGLHWNTYSLNHKTPYTYMANADMAAYWHHLACVSCEAIISSGWSTDLCRYMQNPTT